MDRNNKHLPSSVNKKENNPIQQVKPVSEMTKGEIEASKTAGDPMASEFTSGMEIKKDLSGSTSGDSYSDAEFDFRKDRKFNNQKNKPKPIREHIPGIFFSLIGLLIIVLLMVVLGLVIVKSLGLEDGEAAVKWLGSVLGIY